jgi:hypothetical protein
VFFAAPILGVVLLVVGAGSGVAPYVAAVLIGLALGAEMDLMAFIVSRYFGLKSFGEIFGYLFAIFSLGASVGPIAMGMSFDLTGSYDRGIIGLSGRAPGTVPVSLACGARCRANNSPGRVDVRDREMTGHGPPHLNRGQTKRWKVKWSQRWQPWCSG